MHQERKRARLKDVFAEEEAQKRRNQPHLIAFFESSEKKEKALHLTLPCTVSFFKTYLAHHCFKHLNELCDGKSSVIYSTHSPELIGIKGECHHHTFIVKNNAIR